MIFLQNVYFLPETSEILHFLTVTLILQILNLDLYCGFMNAQIIMTYLPEKVLQVHLA